MEVGSDPQSPDDVASTSQQQALFATPDNDRLKRKRQPRNSACQGCAALKMKCIQTPNGKCERCNRMERDCVPAIPKPRKRRTESLAGIEGEGMSMMEFPASTSTPTGPPPRFVPPRTHADEQGEKGALLSRHDLSHTGSQSFVALFSQGLGNVAVLEDLLRGVDYNFVATSFTIFRQLLPQFPFVELSAGADVISMVARRPVLTLAVCTVACGSSPEAQSRLSQAFQYALASKVILGSERSIDLLTGLLVYLAWHHQYMSHDNIYQELYLLAGMAADLGLYRTRLQPADPATALERDRAFVGCYFLCCNLAAIGFDKPSPLRWTHNLRLCAENAAASGTVPSDRSLVSILELTHALDDMEDGLRQESVGQQGTRSHLIDLHTKATMQRLKALAREYPSLSGSLSLPAATLHIYQRLLRGSITPEYSNLIQCACAIEEYLDDILARPAATLHRIAIVDWTALIEILILTARVSHPLHDSGGWETGALTSMLQPDAALDSICAHMASAFSDDPLSPRHEPILNWLRNVCESIRTRIMHDRGAARGEGQQYDASAPPGQTGDGRFRPTGQEAPGPAGHDIFLASDHGVLDSSFLDTLASAP